MLAEVFDLMGTFVLVPFEIAIYRLLISGEAASGYRFDISTVRFRRMLGWTAAFWVLAIIPLHLPGFVAPSDGAEVIISVVLFALVIFAVLRLTIFLPAIAVDAGRFGPKRFRGYRWPHLAYRQSVLRYSAALHPDGHFDCRARMAWRGT